MDVAILADAELGVADAAGTLVGCAVAIALGAFVDAFAPCVVACAVGVPVADGLGLVLGEVQPAIATRTLTNISTTHTVTTFSFTYFTSLTPFVEQTKV